MLAVLVSKQEQLTACLSYSSFHVTLTTVNKVTSLHCSDQQLPTSGDDDLQKVTTLQCCLVDNCTIMMIDTERNWTLSTLPIVLLSLPNRCACPDFHDDCQTRKWDTSSSMFPKQQQFILTMCFPLVAIVNGSIAVIYMIFKELCSVVDKCCITFW